MLHTFESRTGPSGFPGAAVVQSVRAWIAFDQQTWDGVTWSDVAMGSSALAAYNDIAFPIGVTVKGAISDRFALRVLTGGTDVEVIGERVGELGTFSRNTTVAPINPTSGAPYFRLSAAGWGLGWVPGNTLFLHTSVAYWI